MIAGRVPHLAETALHTSALSQRGGIEIYGKRSRAVLMAPAAVIQPAIPDIGYITGVKGHHDVPPDPRPPLEHPGICPHPAVPR